MEWPISWNDVKKELETIKPKVIDLSNYAVHNSADATIDLGTACFASLQKQLGVDLLGVTLYGPEDKFFEDCKTSRPIQITMAFPGNGNTTGAITVFADSVTKIEEDGEVVQVNFTMLCDMANGYSFFLKFILQRGAVKNSGQIIVKSEYLTTPS